VPPDAEAAPAEDPGMLPLSAAEFEALLDGLFDPLDVASGEGDDAFFAVPMLEEPPLPPILQEPVFPLDQPPSSSPEPSLLVSSDELPSFSLTSVVETAKTLSLGLCRDRVYLALRRKFPQSPIDVLHQACDEAFSSCRRPTARVEPQSPPSPQSDFDDELFTLTSDEDVIWEDSELEEDSPTPSMPDGDDEYFPSSQPVSTDAVEISEDEYD